MCTLSACIHRLMYKFTLEESILRTRATLIASQGDVATSVEISMPRWVIHDLLRSAFAFSVKYALYVW